MKQIQESGYSYQVFVVDNASIDGSQEYIETTFPDICLIKNRENLGFAKANNIAIKQCNSKYLLLVNNDIELPDRVLDDMIDYMELNLNVGISGCQLIAPDNTNQRSFGDFHTFHQECKYLLINIFYPLLRNRESGITCFTDFTEREVDYICGAFFLIRKSVVDQVGAFDEDYFFYVEESDLCYRIKKYTKYRVVFLPNLKVVHHGGGSSSSINQYKYQTQLLKSKLIFAKKYYSWIQFHIYRFFSLLSMLVGCCRKSIKFLIGREVSYPAYWSFFKNTVILYLRGWL